MDWHKLQQTLYNLDPTDPREDLAKIKSNLQSNAGNIEPKKDYVSESVTVPEGSLSLDKNYSIADFAALAGINLSESKKQKDGDYARRKTMPPAKPGRTNHPDEGKLVGEAPLDSVRAGIKSAQSGAFAPDSAEKFVKNKVGGGGATPTDTKPTQQKSQTPRVKSSVTGAQLGKQLGVSDPNAFNQAVMKVKQGQPLNRIHQTAMSDAFVKLMAMDPQSTQRVMQLLKRSESQTESQDKPKQKVQKKSTTNESIKDMLYARLANKNK